MTDETVQQRIERARSQDMEVSLVDSDPVVAQVYNPESDRIHTVVPDSVHCSCEDHTYRDAFCKHMVELLLQNGHVGDVTREAVKQKRNELDSQITQMEAELDQTREQRDQIVEALDAIDEPQVAEETVEDVIDGFEAEAVAQEDAPYESTFERMVEDLSQ